MQPIEPAVGAPLQGVEHLVRILAAKTLEQDFRAIAMAGALRVLEASGRDGLGAAVRSSVEY